MTRSVIDSKSIGLKLSDFIEGFNDHKVVEISENYFLFY